MMTLKKRIRWFAIFAATVVGCQLVFKAMGDTLRPMVEAIVNDTLEDLGD